MHLNSRPLSPSFAAPVVLSAAGVASAASAAAARRGAAPGVLNVACSKSSSALLRMVCASLGWEVETRDNPRGHIFWVVSTDDLQARLERRQHGQWVAKIPGMRELCNKVPFALMMRRIERKSAHFWPQTWVVSRDSGGDRSTLPPKSEYSHGRALIYKPDDGACGDGVYILLSATDLERRVSKVLQVCPRVLVSSGVLCPQLSSCRMQNTGAAPLEGERAFAVVQRYLGAPLLLARQCPL